MRRQRQSPSQKGQTTIYIEKFIASLFQLLKMKKFLPIHLIKILQRFSEFFGSFDVDGHIMIDRLSLFGVDDLETQWKRDDRREKRTFSNYFELIERIFHLFEKIFLFEFHLKMFFDTFEHRLNSLLKMLNILIKLLSTLKMIETLMDLVS